MSEKVLKIEPLRGNFNLECEEIASDKSISHRAAIFSLLASECSEISNYLYAEDTLDSLAIARELGLLVDFENAPENLAELDSIEFKKTIEKYQPKKLKLTPPKQIKEPNAPLFCGNAGTAIRLYMGLLSAQNGLFVLSGDKYLNERPMKRVVEPLRSLGAEIYGRANGNLAPIVICGKPNLAAFSYHSPIPSAQVKSALILSALFSDGVCEIFEPELSRDHTEKMLRGMGADIESSIECGIESNSEKGIECGAKNAKEKVKITIKPLKNRVLKPLNMRIPADPSSAFFFAVAAAIVPNSSVLLRGVLLNPTRIAAFKVLEKMGVQITYRTSSHDFEEIGDIEVKSGEFLRGVEISKNMSWLIDEVPALAVAMACARGKSKVANAAELRVKECDRISAVVQNLRAFGVEISEFSDGFEIIGREFDIESSANPNALKVPCVDSFGDHRIAMAFAILALKTGAKIKDAGAINVSFPNFVEILCKITKAEIVEN